MSKARTPKPATKDAPSTAGGARTPVLSSLIKLPSTTSKILSQCPDDAARQDLLDIRQAFRDGKLLCTKAEAFRQVKAAYGVRCNEGTWLRWLKRDDDDG